MVNRLLTRAVSIVSVFLGIGLSNACLANSANDYSFGTLERSVIESLSLQYWPKATALNPDGNAVRDRDDAARLGQQLFFDARFSGSGSVSCASCHKPDRMFSDGLKVAVGEGVGSRNTPTLVGAYINTWFFVDGRRDSAWSQALTPIETPHEMNGNRLTALRTFFQDRKYREQYIEIFGDHIPDSTMLTRVEAASPIAIDPAQQEGWQRFSAAEQKDLNSHFANLGRLLAAYQQKLRPQVAPFDLFAEALSKGDTAAGKMLSTEALAGLKFFIDSRNQCLKCHQGPAFSDGLFHNLGTGVNAKGILDSGRAAALLALDKDIFSCAGEFNTGQSRTCETREMFGTMGANVVPKGAFRTPTLRQLGYTAPYFHDGRAETLEQVLEHYRSPPKGYGHLHELWPVKKLNDKVIQQLVAFFNTLNSPFDTEQHWFAAPNKQK